MQTAVDRAAERDAVAREGAWTGVESLRWPEIPNEVPAEPAGTNWRVVLERLAENAAPDSRSRMRAISEAALALVMLVATLPIMAVVALIVWLDSPGPILFRQPRVGINGRLFRFTKFRTLYADAKQRWPELYAYHYTAREITELRFKIKDDPRVTRVGRWLRKSTLDELPNLWHVLVGDMALVGPRPEIPEMLPYYDANGLRKFTVRPGVTGLAQVSGRGNLSFFDTVACDVDYVDRRSLLLDVRILCSTLYRAALRDGAF
jgi:lipopolysaccharide/colanic/teichoic acid biosynthesis glycosyltransferase